MRYISFTLTERQIRAQTKTVTRRTGWSKLAPGTLLQPCAKCMGLRKGSHVQRIGRPIRVIDVRREPLSRMLADPEYGAAECAREGFPDMSPADFVSFFARTHGCPRDATVTRIGFEYRTSKREPKPRVCRVCAASMGLTIDPCVEAYYCPECIRARRIVCPRCASLPHRMRGETCDACGLAHQPLALRPEVFR